MKRFHWRLQRLLDVTIQREKALRSELFAMSRKIAFAHQEIFRRQATLRAALSDLTGEAFPDRLPRQAVFMECSGKVHDQLKRLKAKLKELESQRAEITERLMQIRTSRQTLERLREEARQRYLREQMKLEQKALDEIAQVSFARANIQARIEEERKLQAG